MTGAADSTPTPGATVLSRATVETALAVAVRAPSIHNTQPWRWRLAGGVLDLLADRSRQLEVADPDGHSLLVSCGAAAHLTELGLRAAGCAVQTQLLPEPTDQDLLARFTPVGVAEPDAGVGEQVEAALRRRSDRRPFAPHPLEEEVVERLRAAASDADVWVDFPVQPDQRIDLAVAVSWADRVERHDEAYIAEMNRWVRDPEVHAMADGVPLEAIPHVPQGQPRHTDVPLRDFELGISGRQIIERDVDERPLIAVTFTHFDGPLDHLRAGQAMMRLMLEADLAGLVTCPLSQAVDFAAFRTRVQGLMGWIGYPQIMLRIGYPGASTDDLVRTPRREPAAVLEVA
jgi:nitroreductase